MLKNKTIHKLTKKILHYKICGKCTTDRTLQIEANIKKNILKSSKNIYLKITAKSCVKYTCLKLLYSLNLRLC